MTTYLAIAAWATLGPLYALREWRIARRESLPARIARYTMRGEGR